MAESSNLKRKTDHHVHRRPVSKKIRRQEAYSSGSSSESEADAQFFARDAPAEDSMDARRMTQKRESLHAKFIDTNGDDISPKESIKPAERDSPTDSEADHSASEGIESNSDDLSDITSQDGGSNAGSSRRKTKRRDPEVFASSIAAILSSKLPSSKRQDPVLSRSQDAHEANHEINESRLEVKAKRKLRDEKRQAKERGRVKDVLLGDRVADNVLTLDRAEQASSTTSAADIAEQERRLRKTAQRGVVKLFNAVRAAQVRSEQATRAMRTKGVVGHQQREEKIGEMGRQAFLDMVSGGGKAKPST